MISGLHNLPARSRFAQAIGQGGRSGSDFQDWTLDVLGHREWSTAVAQEIISVSDEKCQ